MLPGRFEACVVSDPSKPYIYHRNNKHTMPHWHENIELLLIDGSGTVICDRTDYEVRTRDVAVFGSNVLHAVPWCDGMRYDCLIIDSSFLADSGIDVLSLRFDSVVRDDIAAALYQNVRREVLAVKEGGSFGEAAVKAAILSLMVHICRSYSHLAESERSHGDAVKRALSYIKQHMSEPVTIDEIAAHVMVSKYYFCREFHRETGFTVVRYINNLRCREAEKLLRGSEYTVGEIARMCGFENLSYFTRTFKAVIGATPSEVRSAGA